MIYYTCFTDKYSYLNDFSKFNFEINDGDGEFQIKINLSDLDNFHSFIGYLKTNRKSEILQLLEDWCQDFQSIGEEISEGFEDEILEIITA
jgi:hypothetical protein